MARPDTPNGGRTDLPGPPETADESQRRQLADRLATTGDPARTSLVELRKRAENLTPGHPSSPWNEDGSRRAPEKAPADFELPETHLSDADYATHVKEVARRLDKARADGLATEKLYTVNPDHDIWTLERTSHTTRSSGGLRRCCRRPMRTATPSSLAVWAVPGRPLCLSSTPG